MPREKFVNFLAGDHLLCAAGVHKAPELSGVLHLEFLVNTKDSRRRERLPRILASIREERGNNTCNIDAFSFLEQFRDRFECELELMCLYCVVNRRDLIVRSLLQDIKTTVYEKSYGPVTAVIGNDPSVVEFSQRQPFSRNVDCTRITRVRSRRWSTMASSGVLDVKRIDLETSAAPRFFPYDVRLGEYSSFTTKSPTPTTSARAPSRAS